MHHWTLIQRAGQWWGNLAYRKSFITFSSNAGLRLCPRTLQTCDASVIFFTWAVQIWGMHSEQNPANTQVRPHRPLHVSLASSSFYTSVPWVCSGQPYIKWHPSTLPEFIIIFWFLFLLFSLCKDSIPPSNCPLLFIALSLYLWPLSPIRLCSLNCHQSAWTVVSCQKATSSQSWHLIFAFFSKMKHSKTPGYFGIYLVLLTSFFLITEFL